MREVYYSERFSYGELRQALAQLNFEQHTGRNEFDAPIRVFYYRPSKVTIAVPDKPDDAPLEPIYLRIAERGIEDWGVADSETFFKLLRQAAADKAQVA